VASSKSSQLRPKRPFQRLACNSALLEMGMLGCRVTALHWGWIYLPRLREGEAVDYLAGDMEGERGKM
jgi:hypothetical protein